MIKKILKPLLLILALIAGGAGGIFLKPSSDKTAAEGHTEQTGEHDVAADSDGHETHAADKTHDASHNDGHDDHGESGATGKIAWFNFSRQFFVPLLREGDESGMIILSMALETNSGDLKAIAEQEIRLRDLVLRQLLIAANTGRFDGNFTTEGRMRGLRKQVLEALSDTLDNKVTAVLISDIARQEE